MLADLRQPEDASCGSAHCQYFLSRNDVIVVEKCMSSMQAGTQMIKLRGSSKGLVRFYYLDEHKSCIRWRPSRKNEKAKISIDSIQEVCEGKQSEIFQRYADGSFDPNCCFSIYYGDHMESLDLVSSSGEEARTWITGLKYLMAGISDEDSLSKRQRTRDQWLKQTFDEADKNGDGSLSINEVLQLMHKLNVNLPRQKVKQMFKEADTDDNQGTLDFEEFCAFYKMMSTRRDLYLLMLTYSNHKDYLDVDDLRRFLDSEQKMCSVNKDHCLEIINQFEPCPENRKQGALGIDGFTNYMRSPAGDIFNPEHYQVNQDMTRPLSHYFITSSHNTYLMGDQLMSQSRVDMYAWVLQSGCRCVEVDCWDGPDGEPIVHHGYTLTSKILFKDVIETINKYAFIRSEYPVILSIENHCSVAQQKKMAQYLTEILGDKLDLSSVSNGDPGKLPSPESLKGKILVKGKKLPANISEDVEEGEVSDEDSADEMEDDCKLMNGDASTNRKRVENIAKKKLDSLIKESKIRDCEDPNNFTVATLPPSGKLGNKHDLKKNKHEEDVESGQDAVINKRHNRSLMGSFSKRKKKGSKLKRASSLEDGEDDLNCQGNIARGSVHYSKTSRQKKTMKLSRALSDLVKYTKSVGIHDVESEISSSWQVSSFSETKAHQILQQKPAQYLRFNQHQLSRIYPSSYRVDSSNYNPQPFWNAGCQLVALNYQSEGRMLQLNRAKFNANGNCGYVLKPTCMCQGTFNPNSEDPLLGQMKKQLVLRIISGQQLPKPRDSMLGDRGEIIDPFVEVEIIGLPVDCCKEQTRVVDDNGFNPMWEETLVFSICMPEITLVRFLVWDHDPIGRDFIGQRTISFTSMMPGYRHVYLEGMEEASIFVHVAVNDICGKVKQALGLKGLFLRSPKQASLDSHAAGQLNRKDSFSSHLLRRTASAPTKTQKKTKKGFPEIVIDAKDNGSEGTSEDHEFEDSSHPRFDQEPECASPALSLRDGAHREAQGKGLKGKAQSFGKGKGSHAQAHRDAAFSEPIRRANRVRLQEPPNEKQGVFARCAINGSGRIGMATNCMKCMIGSNESPDLECKWSNHAATRPASNDTPHCNQYSSLSGDEERLELKNWGVQEQQPKPQADLRLCSGYGAADHLPKTCQPPATSGKRNGDPKSHGGKGHPRQRWQGQPGGKYGSTVNLVTASNGSVSSDSSSLESLGSPDFPKRLSESSRKQAGTLQREMNALFAEKLEEIRSKSPIFFTGKTGSSSPPAVCYRSCCYFSFPLRSTRILFFSCKAIF
ncbi:1-phosphatidylinositol 4,5-bisphosphate phosphodiesterase eta-2 isoform X3 [Sceloporus undulatus]|uniref:1-phosphatidylinositol 4,5-bisphosphate phosphodiesterase eta-2 isoform X3 n=1 Tax=Sceloporus undulatus TaxID=8520 RepID=UPI001C4B971E|nr:1-phosphatidylinositol 4,5-bisphosphate phosphodiesterase eta-2 isoform X3 [Sceloporus undulatus]